MGGFSLSDLKVLYTVQTVKPLEANLRSESFDFINKTDGTWLDSRMDCQEVPRSLWGTSVIKFKFADTIKHITHAKDDEQGKQYSSCLMPACWHADISPSLKTLA